MKIESITLVRGSGPDTLIIKVDLPNGCYPYDGNAYMKMDVAAGKGQEYCAKHFPNIPLEIID